MANRPLLPTTLSKSPVRDMRSKPTTATTSTSTSTPAAAAKSRPPGPRSAYLWLGPISILVGILVLVAALSTTHWLECHQPQAVSVSSSGPVVHGGLFTLCFPNHTCTMWTHTTFNYDLAMLSIAAIIIACVLYVQSTIVLGVFAWRRTTTTTTDTVTVTATSGSMRYWRGFPMWMAGIMMNISGMALFLQFQSQSLTIDYLGKTVCALSHTDIGYSFHLCWVASLVVLLGCLTPSLVDIFHYQFGTWTKTPGDGGGGGRGGGGGGRGCGGGGIANHCYDCHVKKTPVFE